MNSLLQRLSPRHRRWNRLLESLTFDPDVGPVEAPSARDFLICGSPRSGTALLTAQLFRPPRVVTVMEPWDGLRFGPAALFESLRREIGQSGGLRRGKLDVDALRRTREVAWAPEGRTTVPIEGAADALLGVKWPGYWRYLGHLPDTKFLICVRDPVSTIASYKAAGGRLSQGLEYDVAFHRAMNDHLTAATDDERLRRVLLYDYIGARIAPHIDQPNTFVVRYERWVNDAAGLLAEIGAFLGVELSDPPADIRSPRAPGLTDVEHDMVHSHCSSAVALGYQLR